MKQKILYTCELCKTDYADKKKATECECGHKTDLKVIDARYKSIKAVTHGFPTKITVRSKDGKEMTYTL
nr:MAG TPA: DNA-directed RNA polymerase [Caudoviricetes sp.]DAT97259.1 MAG TPA: DNA-directed RNA polymerase [Caudoviricetes sp.]